MNHGLLKRVGQILPFRGVNRRKPLNFKNSSEVGQGNTLESVLGLAYVSASETLSIENQPDMKNISGQSSHRTETPICYELSSLRLCSKRQDFQPGHSMLPTHGTRVMLGSTQLSLVPSTYSILQYAQFFILHHNSNFGRSVLT